MVKTLFSLSNFCSAFRHGQEPNASDRVRDGLLPLQEREPRFRLPLCFTAFALGSMATLLSTASLAHGGLEEALTCAAKPDRLQRLQCYDALFQNREVLVEVSKPETPADPAPSLPPTSLLSRLQSLEALRPIDDMAWFLRLRPWDTKAYLKPQAR